MGQGWTGELTQPSGLGAHPAPALRGHSGAGAAGCLWGASGCAVLLGEKIEDLGVSAAGRRWQGGTAMPLSPFMPVLSRPHVCT